MAESSIMNDIDQSDEDLYEAGFPINTNLDLYIENDNFIANTNERTGIPVTPTRNTSTTTENLTNMFSHFQNYRRARSSQNSSSGTVITSGQSILLILKPSTIIGRIHNNQYYLLGKKLISEIEINGIIKSVPIIANKTKLISQNECLFEIYDYYGPLQITIKIYQYILFAKKLLGTKIMDLESFQTLSSSSSGNKVIKLVQQDTPLRNNKTMSLNHHHPHHDHNYFDTSTSSTNQQFINIPLESSSVWTIGNRPIFPDIFSKLGNCLRHSNTANITNNTSSNNNTVNANIPYSNLPQQSSLHIYHSSALTLVLDSHLIFYKNCLTKRPFIDVLPKGIINPSIHLDNTNATNSNNINMTRAVNPMNDNLQTNNNIIISHNSNTNSNNNNNNHNMTTNSTIDIMTTTNTTTSRSYYLSQFSTYFAPAIASTTIPTLLSTPISVTDFHIAVAYGSVELVNYLLYIATRNQNLNILLSIRDSGHRNALDLALLHNNIKVVKTLLRKAGHLCFQKIEKNTSK